MSELNEADAISNSGDETLFVADFHEGKMDLLFEWESVEGESCYFLHFFLPDCREHPVYIARLKMIEEGSPEIGRVKDNWWQIAQYAVPCEDSAADDDDAPELDQLFYSQFPQEKGWSVEDVKLEAFRLVLEGHENIATWHTNVVRSMKDAKQVSYQ